MQPRGYECAWFESNEGKGWTDHINKIVSKVSLIELINCFLSFLRWISSTPTGQSSPFSASYSLLVFFRQRFRFFVSWRFFVLFKKNLSLRTFLVKSTLSSVPTISSSTNRICINRISLFLSPFFFHAYSLFSIASSSTSWSSERGVGGASDGGEWERG